MFPGVWPRPNPKVSVVVYQQVAEHNPADLLGQVLRGKEAAEFLTGYLQRRWRIRRRLSHESPLSSMLLNCCKISISLITAVGRILSAIACFRQLPGRE